MRPHFLIAVAAGCLSIQLFSSPIRAASNDAAAPVATPPTPPPSAVRASENSDAARPVAERKREKGTYLGLAASPLFGPAHEKLGLPGGVGLVVDTVAPKTPADESGLKGGDVLYKLNDQLLINPQQLAVLVRTFKPGEVIKLSIYRDGKPMELSATLVEKELRPLAEMRLGGDDPFRPPFILPDNFPGMLEGPGHRPGVDPSRPFPELSALLKEDFDLVWDDGKVRMNISVRDGKKSLIAKDKDGKELYNGPVDTEEQRQALPLQVRDRLPQLGLPGMFRPSTGHEAPNPDDDRNPAHPSTRPATQPSASVQHELTIHWSDRKLADRGETVQARPG